MSKRPRKVRRDARLKNLPLAQRKLVAEWLEEDGPESCAQRCLSELGISGPTPGKPVSPATLYEALAFWRVQAELDTAFAERDAQEELMRQFRPDDAKLAREFAEFTFLQRANRTGNEKLFTAATMAADMRRDLDLKERSGQTRAEQTALKIAQKDRDFALQREKFIVEACEKIIAAARDPKTRAIAEDTSITNAEKIARMRRMHFADIDALEASGEVRLPE